MAQTGWTYGILEVSPLLPWVTMWPWWKQLQESRTLPNTDTIRNAAESHTCLLLLLLDFSKTEECPIFVILRRVGIQWKNENKSLVHTQTFKTLETQKQGVLMIRTCSMEHKQPWIKTQLLKRPVNSTQSPHMQKWNEQKKSKSASIFWSWFQGWIYQFGNQNKVLFRK